MTMAATDDAPSRLNTRGALLSEAQRGEATVAEPPRVVVGVLAPERARVGGLVGERAALLEGGRLGDANPREGQLDRARRWKHPP